MKQSSTGWGGAADRGNDGNTDGIFGNGSVSHTDADGSPWWQVDLGEEYDISRLVIWNRTDCCSQRLTNFRVSILDGSLAELWGEDFFTDGRGFPNPDPEIVLPEVTPGQIVRVSLLPPQFADAFLLSLAEVQVFVEDTALPLTIARQPASGHVVAGRPFRFSVELLDPTGASYQWKKDGNPMGGKTEPTLSICRTAPADAGTYTVTATRGAEARR